MAAGWGSQHSFLPRMVQTRIARNTIRSLTTEQGTVLTSTVDIKKEAVSHFQRFLQSQDASGEDVSVDDLRNLLTYRCPAEACASLVAPVTGLEIPGCSACAS